MVHVAKNSGPNAVSSGSTSKIEDPVGQYLAGVSIIDSWSSETHTSMRAAVGNNPYAVFSAVSRLLGDSKVISREKMLETGGTTDRVGRGTVIDNMHNKAWGAILRAAGSSHSEATIREVVTKAGEKRDEAFQPKMSTWTTSSGKEVTGPVFTWERWNGKTWVNEK
jgi:hypothetical protein